MATKCCTRRRGHEGEVQWGSGISLAGCLRCALAAAVALAVTAAAAADYPTKKAPPPAPAPVVVAPSRRASSSRPASSTRSTRPRRSCIRRPRGGAQDELRRRRRDGRQRRHAGLRGGLLRDAERVGRHFRRRSDVGGRQDEGHAAAGASPSLPPSATLAGEDHAVVRSGHRALPFQSVRRVPALSRRRRRGGLPSCRQA